MAPGGAGVENLQGSGEGQGSGYGWHQEGLGWRTSRAQVRVRDQGMDGTMRGWVENLQGSGEGQGSGIMVEMAPGGAGGGEPPGLS